MKRRDQIGYEIVVLDMGDDLRRLGHDETSLAGKVLSQLHASFGSMWRLAQRCEDCKSIFN
jgi:hypothetical protein